MLCVCVCVCVCACELSLTHCYHTPSMQPPWHQQCYQDNRSLESVLVNIKNNPEKFIKLRKTYFRVFFACIAGGYISVRGEET